MAKRVWFTRHERSLGRHCRARTVRKHTESICEPEPVEPETSPRPVDSQTLNGRDCAARDPLEHSQSRGAARSALVSKE